jgi:hypothetical protein
MTGIRRRKTGSSLLAGETAVRASPSHQPAACPVRYRPGLRPGCTGDVPGTQLGKIVTQDRYKRPLQVTKDIGILYCYGLPQSHPSSVPDNPILGSDELDRVGEGF